MNKISVLSFFFLLKKWLRRPQIDFEFINQLCMNEERFPFNIEE